MNLFLFLEQTLNGLQLGVMLFLMAAGLTLVFGIMNLVNLAHGSLYMVGAYLATYFYQATGSFALGVLLGLLGTLVVGMVVELVALRTLYERDRERERAGLLKDERGEVRAHHVKRAVSEVDEIHDAEHQRQAGGQQEQHHPELQPVERLFRDENEVHQQKRGAARPLKRSSPAPTTSSGNPWRRSPCGS